MNVLVASIHTKGTKMLDMFEFSFFQNAFLASIFISLACGIIGSLVMINRLFSMAGGITHGAFGGIGLAFYFSLPLLLCTSIFTLFLALIVAFLSKRFPHRSDNFIAVIWAFGMALGLILIDLSAGYKSDLMAYLFGSILAVSSADLWLIFGANCLFIVLVLAFYRQFVAISFDQEFALLRGVNTNFFYYLLICMIAFCIVICMRCVGLILIIALLSFPCFIAEYFTQKLLKMMALASLLSFIFCFLGLILSFVLNLSSSASIIMIACLAFVLVFIVKRRKN